MSFGSSLLRQARHDPGRTRLTTLVLGVVYALIGGVRRRKSGPAARVRCGVLDGAAPRRGSLVVSRGSLQLGVSSSLTVLVAATLADRPCLRACSCSAPTSPCSRLRASSTRRPSRRSTTPASSTSCACACAPTAAASTAVASGSPTRSGTTSPQSSWILLPGDRVIIAGVASARSAGAGPTFGVLARAESRSATDAGVKQNRRTRRGLCPGRS